MRRFILQQQSPRIDMMVDQCTTNLPIRVRSIRHSLLNNRGNNIVLLERSRKKTNS